MVCKDCCCCNLESGVFFCAVFEAFVCGCILAFGNFENSKQWSLLTTKSLTAFALIDLLKTSFLLFGICLKNANSVLVYIIINGAVLAVVSVICISLMTLGIFETVPILLVCGLLSMFMMFVYSYYEQMEE